MRVFFQRNFHGVLLSGVRGQRNRWEHDEGATLFPAFIPPEAASRAAAALRAEAEGGSGGSGGGPWEAAPGRDLKRMKHLKGRVGGGQPPEQQREQPTGVVCPSTTLLLQGSLGGVAGE